MIKNKMKAVQILIKKQDQHLKNNKVQSKKTLSNHILTLNNTELSLNTFKIGLNI